MTNPNQDNRPPILEPGRADHRYWIDLWRYRELFFIVAWRDVAVHYKQSVIAIVWAFAGRSSRSLWSWPLAISLTSPVEFTELPAAAQEPKPGPG